MIGTPSAAKKPGEMERGCALDPLRRAAWDVSVSGELETETRRSAIAPGNGRRRMRSCSHLAGHQCDESLPCRNPRPAGAFSIGHGRNIDSQDVLRIETGLRPL